MKSLIASLTLLASLSAASVLAHEGHDHGAPPPPVSATIAPRADASSPDFELVAIARGERVRIYLDRFRGNEPVTGAAIEVDGPGGTVQAAPDGEGAYVIPAPWAMRAGAHDLAITVQADGLIDVLTTTLTIRDAPAPAAAPASAVGWLVGGAMAQDIRQRISDRDASLWAVGGGAFVAGLLAALLFRRRAAPAAAAALIGFAAFAAAPWAEAASPPQGAPASAAATVERDIAQRFPDGAIFVPKATQRILAIRTVFTETRSYAGTVELPARVIHDPGTTGLVQAAVAGRLSPPPGGFPRLGSRVQAGDTLAYVQPAIGAADVTTQQLQARELDQQIALAERRLERARQIQSIVARSQLEDLELELQGLRARRANLERAPREAERLVAPVAGVIAAVQAVAGQIAEPNAVIFQIVDPARFWVEALSFEAQALEGRATGRLSDGRSVPLQYRGSGLADRNQAIPVQFSVDAGARGLRAGQLLTVLAATQDERSGVAVPRTSVLRGANGQAVVYEHANAERFVPREVRVEPLDGERVLVVSGLGPNKRVVTQGAELLNQIR